MVATTANEATTSPEIPVSGYKVTGATAAPTVPLIAAIILPAFNEALALPSVLTALVAVLGANCEVIVVDDGSTDETAFVASRYPCRLVRHEHNRGKGAAVRTGIQAAHADFIVIMDADNTYPAESVRCIIAASEKYDIVRGVRSHSTSNMPLVNRIGNGLFDFTLRTVYGLQGSDHLSGLYGARRSVFNRMQLTSNGFDLEVEIGVKAHNLGLRSGVLLIDYQERLGEKKLHALRDGWHILMRVAAMALPGGAFSEGPLQPASPL